MKKRTSLFNALSFLFMAICFTNIPSAYGQFVKSIGGTNADYGQAITSDTSGNVYVIGDFMGKPDFDPGPGVFNKGGGGGGGGNNNQPKPDIFFAKYTSTGALVWAKKVGGPGIENSKAIGVDAAGNVYITGTFELTADFDPGNGVYNLTSHGGLDIFLAKYNSNGVFVWANNIGGQSFDFGNSLSVSSAGVVTIAGSFNGNVDFDPTAGSTFIDAGTSSDAFFAQYKADGKLAWVKDIAGTGETVAQSIFVDTASVIYITGNFFGTSDFNPGPGTFSLTGVDAKDPFFAKYNSKGDLIWAASLSGPGDQSGQSIVADKSGNAYITGYFQGKIDFNPGAAQFYLTSAGPGFFNSYLLKLDSQGKFVWANNIGGSQEDVGLSLAVDASQVVNVTGYFSGSADFTSVNTTSLTTLTSAGGTDIYLAGYTQGGQILYAKNLGGATNDWANSVATDAKGFVYLTGYYTTKATFTDGVTLLSAGDADVYILKSKTLETNYCNSGGTSSAAEWISSVTLSDLQNSSGSNNGYGDYTTKTATIAVGAAYSITTRAVFASTQYSEFWTVWIDYNKDGDFNDANELLVQYKSSGAAAVINTFTLPSNAGGVTRMRVAMNRTSYSNPCGTFAKGEVEDYTINILPQTSPGFSRQNMISSISGPLTLSPNPARDFLTIKGSFSGKVLIAVYDATGKIVLSKKAGTLLRAQLNVSTLSNGIYILRITGENDITWSERWVKE